MGRCRHRKAVVVRNGQLFPEERRMPFDAAWCPAKGCGAFREASATKDPEPWQYPGGKVAPAGFELTPPGEGEE